jgi:hypothetical protein
MSCHLRLSGLSDLTSPSEMSKVIGRRAADTGGLPSRKRSCQRQTRVLDLAVCRMISFVPTPSAVNSTISARQTCFCGVLRP